MTTTLEAGPALARAATREIRTPIMESARWAEFATRPDDIVIATYAKCGTTWTQRIVDLLVWQDPSPRPVFQISVWLDARIFGTQEENLATLGAQTHRRYIKSHLPFDALPIYEGVKYIHVARDGRDAFMSWHNHMVGTRPEIGAKIGAIIASDPVLQKAMAGGPPPGPTPDDPHEFFQGWIAEAEHEADAAATGSDLGVSYFGFENTYWSERHRPNLLMVHYNDLKADLAGEMARISEFLEIDTPPERLQALAAAAQFDAMKKDGAALLPHIEEHFDKGHERFLNKGTNGRWKDVLTAEDLARYDAVAARRLSPSLAAWLQNGRRVTGDPRKLPD